MASNLRVDTILPSTGTSLGIGTVSGTTTVTGTLNAASATITGNLGIGGTLTYEDVTNVDSIGIITARSTVSIADSIVHTGDTNTSLRFPAADTISAETGGLERLRITSNGNLLIGSSNESNNIRLGNDIGIVGTTAYTGMSITNYPGTNASHAGLFDFNRSRGTSDQSMTSVAASDKLGEIIFRGSNGSAFADAVTLRAYADNVDGSYVNGKFEISTALSGSMDVRLRISKEGYVTKPTNPIFHAFGGPSNVNTNTDIVFGQERFDIGNGYNTSTGEYTAPATGYYHFYCQVYRQTTSSDSWWGFYYDSGSGYAQISESRMENDYGGDSGRGYSTLQSSIYWYMTAGQKMKCRVGNIGAIHCNNTLSYFCGNLVG